jgi:predicted nucleotide-binding protein
MLHAQKVSEGHVTKLSKNEATTRLTKQVGSIESLRNEVLYSPHFKKWLRDTQVAIEHIFGSDSRHVKDFNGIHYSLGMYTDATPESRFQEAYVNGLDNARAILQSMIDEISEYWEDDELVTRSIDPRVRNRGAVLAMSRESRVFIGHGGSKLWARLKTYLEDELGLATLHYESESHVSESIISVLNRMLDDATFAILILTAEDETQEGSRRARQNVVHEAGLFQGRLGFDKVVLLRQEGLEDFSNVAGLQYIRFRGEQIEETFYELQRVLIREQLIMIVL